MIAAAADGSAAGLNRMFSMHGGGVWECVGVRGVEMPCPTVFRSDPETIPAGWSEGQRGKGFREVSYAEVQKDTHEINFLEDMLLPMHLRPQYKIALAADVEIPGGKPAQRGGGAGHRQAQKSPGRTRNSDMIDCRGGNRQ